MRRPTYLLILQLISVYHRFEVKYLSTGSSICICWKSAKHHFLVLDMDRLRVACWYRCLKLDLYYTDNFFLSGLWAKVIKVIYWEYVTTCHIQASYDCLGSVYAYWIAMWANLMVEWIRKQISDLREEQVKNINDHKLRRKILLKR